MNEQVDHPEHYQGKHECIDVMRAMFGDVAVRGFCRCNAFKYRFRAGKMENLVSGLVSCGWGYDDVMNFIEHTNTKKLV